MLLLQIMSQVIFLTSLSCTASGEEAGKRDLVNYTYLTVVIVNPLSPPQPLVQTTMRTQHTPSCAPCMAPSPSAWEGASNTAAPHTGTPPPSPQGFPPAPSAAITSPNPGWGSVTSPQAKEAQWCTDSPAGRELGWLYQPQHRVKSLKKNKYQEDNAVLTKSRQEFVEAIAGYSPELQKIKLGAVFADTTLDLFFARRLFHCMWTFQLLVTLHSYTSGFRKWTHCLYCQSTLQQQLSKKKTDETKHLPQVQEIRDFLAHQPVKTCQPLVNADYTEHGWSPGTCSAALICNLSSMCNVILFCWILLECQHS